MLRFHVVFTQKLAQKPDPVLDIVTERGQQLLALPFN